MNSWVFPALITFLFWGVAVITPKIALQYINPMSVVVYETIGSLTIAFVVLIIIGFRPDVHFKGIMFAILTGSLYVCGALAFFYALNSGRVSIVVVFTALYPVIPILYGFFILKEPIALKEGLGMVFAFAAIVLFSI